jgi:hypothetical protein
VSFSDRFEKKEFSIPTPRPIILPSGDQRQPKCRYGQSGQHHSAGGNGTLCSASPSCINCRTGAEAEAELQTEQLTLKLQPNPAGSEVSIDLSGFEGEYTVWVSIRDVNGKLFVMKQVQRGEGIGRVTLPVSHLLRDCLW